MGAAAFWGLLKEAGEQWWQDNAPRLGAALAFYATFSLAPLLLITMAIAGLLYGPEAAQGRLLAQLSDLVGDEMGAAVQATIAGASEPADGLRAAMVGAVILLVGATGFFAELHDALNTIWKAPPPGGSGVWQFAKARLLSFAMVLFTSCVLLASLVASAIVSKLGREFGRWQPLGLGETMNFVLSLAVFTLLFAMIYRYLPNAPVTWKQAIIGAAVTSLLFSLGRVLIGLYLGRTAVTSSFGAAGSLAALLIWLYYSAQIFLFGAELTRAHGAR